MLIDKKVFLQEVLDELFDSRPLSGQKSSVIKALNKPSMKNFSETIAIRKASLFTVREALSLCDEGALIPEDELCRDKNRRDQLVAWELMDRCLCSFVHHLGVRIAGQKGLLKKDIFDFCGETYAAYRVDCAFKTRGCLDPKVRELVHLMVKDEDQDLIHMVQAFEKAAHIHRRACVQYPKGLDMAVLGKGADSYQRREASLFTRMRKAVQNLSF